MVDGPSLFKLRFQTARESPRIAKRQIVLDEPARLDDQKAAILLLVFLMVRVIR